MDFLASRSTVPLELTFSILGTIEPRKRHRVVIEAFEHLWSAGHDFRLVILGAEGWEQPELIERIRKLALTTRVEWIERPSDNDVAATLARSWAVIFTPYAEGYGLPPLEALAAGCPVIVASDLPALEEIPQAGQIRLDQVNPDTVAGAVETLAQIDRNDSLRSAIGGLALPTWREFASDVEEWIASVLDGDAAHSPHADGIEES